MIDTIGYIAAILTTISFLPQALKTIKTRDTSGISLLMYAVFSTGVFLWFIYGVSILDFPILIANGITFIFSIIILTYKIINVRIEVKMRKNP
jgi:MtN3 and saliva related transmembrane protein